MTDRRPGAKQPRHLRVKRGPLASPLPAFYAHETVGPDCVPTSDDPDDHVRYDKAECGCNVCACGEFVWHSKGCNSDLRGPTRPPQIARGGASDG